MLWNQDNAVQATGGEVFGLWQAHKPCIDTRKLEPGDLFVAFKGEFVDGHDFVGQALANGANAAMVERIPEGVDKRKLLLVKDCQNALVDLANYNRAKLQARIIGVTGSVGKTSTKELAHLAFAAIGNTYSNKGNYNNHLGLPITLASIPLSTEYVVLEMGMSNASEMLHLTKLARPDVVIITNIAGVHLANFASLEEIAKAKSEIFAGMNESGAVILNKESRFLDLLMREAKARDISNIFTFGSGADSYLIDYKLNTAITANILGQECQYRIEAFGAHHATNSLAILTAVKFLGGDLQRAASALAQFKNIKGRGEISHLHFNNKQITLIDDSYNASPMSLRAALIVLGSNFPSAKRRVAILADMRELGANEIDEHKDIVDPIVENKIDKVVTVGDLMKHLHDSLPTRLQLKHYQGVDETFTDIVDLIQDGDVILIKGSNGTKIYKLIDYFKGQA